MKGYIPLVLILLALFGGLVWLFIYTGASPAIENPQFTVGHIKGFKQAQKSAGLDAIVVFHVNGDDYEIRISSFKYQANVKGEKFKIKYEKTDPSVNIILKYEPVFVSGERTKSVDGTITRIYKFNWLVDQEQPTEGVEFDYAVNNKVIKKSQVLPPNYKSQFPDIKEGNVYAVEYWEHNPERSIIYLNKPMQ
ncbi:MAG: hypothetical protein ACK5XV_06620 [Flavobacteriales bacterium]